MSIKVIIKVQNLGEMKLTLAEEKAPITVANFVQLAKKGFYNGLCFHRVIENFMIQGGCPEGSGMGGPGYQIKGEFSRNGVQNDLKHLRGVISMARSSLPNSAGSQFFIMHDAAPHLDGSYAAFGYMEDGFEILDTIAKSKVDRMDRPLSPVIIESVSILTDEENLKRLLAVQVA